MSQDKSPESGKMNVAGHGPLITCGEGRDIITIQRLDGIVHITIAEEAAGSTMVSAAQQAIEAGILTGEDGVLVDMTKFIGAIDWSAIHTVREMKVWDQGARATARVAFLVRDSAFASLVTLAGALFPRATLRLFTDRATALAWMKAAAD